MTESAKPQRHFLGWDRPVIEGAAAFLLRGWVAGGRGPSADLSGVLAVVPTRHAGRRLREALAQRLGEAGAAAVPPAVWTPEALAARGLDGRRIAGPAAALYAWARVLREADLKAFPYLFPRPPEEPAPNWALQLAADFQRLRADLGEAGIGMRGAMERLGPTHEEFKRWENLAELEQRYLKTLAFAGLEDAQAAKAASARSITPPDGVARAVVIAAPDFLGLAEIALGRLAAQIPVDVLVAAPDALADRFDEWGRPGPEWEIAPLEIPDAAGAIHLVNGPGDQAAAALRIARGHPFPAGALAVGACDPEVAAEIERAFGEAGIQTFNPEGKRGDSHPIYYILRTFADLARTGSFDAFADLLRCPGALKALAGESGARPADLLRGFDRLRAAHLPDTLADAAALLRAGKAEAEPQPALLAAAAAMQAHCEALGGDFGAAVARFLAFAHTGMEFQAEDERHAAFLAFARRLNEILDEMEQPPFGPEAGALDKLDILLRLAGETALYPERAPSHVDVLGWLELLWEDAPHLAVAGFNDGFAPASLRGDAFLPHALRERLGMKTNAQRLARDAFIAAYLIESRRRGGRADFILGRANALGDPLKPSRLLLMCPDRELPRRALDLFQPEPDAVPERPAPWTRAWRLRPPPPAEREPLDHLNVTAFGRYLRCPFRFYLSDILRMRAVDPLKQEMDAMEFGNLCHDAMRALARNDGLRASDDEKALREFLAAQVERLAEARFGKTLPVPVLIQVEGASTRLAAAAAVHAKAVREGWRIVRAEVAFDKLGAGLEAGGIPVRGTIDRLEEREVNGRREIRVLDYKTSDKPKDPGPAHFRPIRRDESDSDFPEWRIAPRAPAEWRASHALWQDLQLPLYAEAAARYAPGAKVVAGYFHLPQAASDTSITTWDDLDGDLLESARACAEGVAEAIKAGAFWPPDEADPRWDEFGALFHRGTAESVAWE